jgi:general secretion pathway protein E
MDTAAGQPSRESLDEILIRTGMITPELMQTVLQTAQRESKPVEQILIEDKLLTPRNLARAASIQLRVPLIAIDKHKIHPEIIKLIPEELARKYNILPLDIIGSSLVLVMGDTIDVQAIDDITAMSKMRIEPVMAVPEEIRKAIDRNYSGLDKLESEIAVWSPAATEEEIDPIDLITEEDETSAVHHFNVLVQQAVRSRASDMHIEPQKDRLQVRYRIDGVLRDTMSLLLNIHPALISRLKIITGMNIAERRRSQDGRCSVRVDGADIDIRAACGNTIHGEMAALRLLPKSASLLELSVLGFLPGTLERYQQMLKFPYGIILFGGPTGSGKTTTLYASVNQLDRMERNIVTIEDPVEYHFEGINQFQINPKAGVSFANSLRAFMRLDPDVILVGEIRDTETAKLAIQAALTGHLVFSSIHANDSVGIMFRLQNLGVDNFLICSALVGTVAQRIIRRICPHCRISYEPPVEERMAYQEEIGKLPTQFYKGAGCSFCADTGYLGRCGIYELLTPTEEVKQLFLNGATVAQIRAQTSKEGMVSLAHDGMLKVTEGITTISEVLRNVFSINY